MLAEVDPELAAPADRVRPLGGGRWELKAVIDDEYRRGLERLKGLLSHVDPHLTLGQFMGRLVREGLDRHDPARAARRAGQRRRANFGGEDAGSLGSRRCLGSEAGGRRGQRRSFGGEGIGSGAGAAGRRSR